MSYKPPSVWYVCKYCRRSYRVRNDLIRHKHEHSVFREQKHRQRLENLIRDSLNQASCLNTKDTNTTTEKTTQKGRIEINNTNNNKNNTDTSSKVSSSSERTKDQMRVLAQPQPPIQVQVQAQPVKLREDLTQIKEKESTIMDKEGEKEPEEEEEQVQTIIEPFDEGAETILGGKDDTDERMDEQQEQEEEGQSEMAEDDSVSKSTMKNCDRCPKSFSSEYYLKYHELLDHSGDSPTSSSSSSLQSPNSTNSLNQSYDQLIEPDSTNFNSLKRNVPSALPPPPHHSHNQNDKKKKTKKGSKVSNKVNKSSKSNITYSSCQVCQKKFKNAGHLKSHMKSHERTGKTFYCRFCQKTLELRDEAFFHRHVDICSKETEFPCSVSHCSLTFHFKADLQTHELVDHGIMAELHCAICSRLFTRKSALDSHLRIQHCRSLDQFVES